MSHADEPALRSLAATAVKLLSRSKSRTVWQFLPAVQATALPGMVTSLRNTG
jgi:hypothetical protein